MGSVVAPEAHATQAVMPVLPEQHVLHVVRPAEEEKVLVPHCCGEVEQMGQ